MPACCLAGRRSENRTDLLNNGGVAVPRMAIVIEKNLLIEFREVTVHRSISAA